MTTINATTRQLLDISGNHVAIDVYVRQALQGRVAQAVEAIEDAETAEERTRAEREHGYTDLIARLEHAQGGIDRATAIAQAVIEVEHGKSAYTAGANAVLRRAGSIALRMEDMATDKDDLRDHTLAELRDQAVAAYESGH